MIPDAPWIRAAENYGCDYMYEFVYGEEEENEDD